MIRQAWKALLEVLGPWGHLEALAFLEPLKGFVQWRRGLMARRSRKKKQIFSLITRIHS